MTTNKPTETVFTADLLAYLMRKYPKQMQETDLQIKGQQVVPD